MATVALLGTFDTKGEEYAWLKDRLGDVGVDVITVDAGGAPSESSMADITSQEVINAAKVDVDAVRERRDRGETMTVMGLGAARIITSLADEGRIHGVLAAGGSGGSSVAAPVMQALPIGFPKLLVSTMASGDVKPYVGAVDTTMTYSVVDVAGLNSISQMVLGNAVAAIAGMAKAFEARAGPAKSVHKPLVGVTASRGVRPDHHRAGGRPGRRGPQCWAQPPRDGRSTPAPTGGQPRRPRYGQLGPRGHRAREVRQPEPARAQPHGHADADHYGGDGRTR